MKFELTSIQPYQKSKHGGLCTLLTFRRASDLKSFNTWIATNCRNKARWEAVMRAGVGAIITNLVIKTDTLINADSFPFIEQMGEKPKPIPPAPKPKPGDWVIGKEPNVIGNCQECGGGLMKTSHTDEEKNPQTGKIIKKVVWELFCVGCGKQLG